MIKEMNGSLVALACGDSYGSSYEMRGLVGERFDIKTLPDFPEKLQVTDDTKMAMILLKHYSKTKSLIPEMLFYEYKKWALRDGDNDGIGIHTKAVLVDGKSDKNSQGNGALMRNIPFGCQLIEDGYRFDDAVALMNKESSLTHSNETIFQANALALDLALYGVEEVLNKKIHQPLLNRLHFGHTAWVIHSLFIVIEALKRDVSFLDGFKYIVSQGGDTDTNCAIYGAIRGYRDNILKNNYIYSFLMNINIFLV